MWRKQLLDARYSRLINLAMLGMANLVIQLCKVLNGAVLFTLFMLVALSYVSGFVQRAEGGESLPQFVLDRALWLCVLPAVALICVLLMWWQQVILPFRWILPYILAMFLGFGLSTLEEANRRKQSTGAK